MMRFAHEQTADTERAVGMQRFLTHSTVGHVFLKIDSLFSMAKSIQIHERALKRQASRKRRTPVPLCGVATEHWDGCVLCSLLCAQPEASFSHCCKRMEQNTQYVTFVPQLTMLSHITSLSVNLIFLFD